MQVAESLRKPGDCIPNPDPNAAPGSTIPRPPYTFGAKSHKRLLAACDIVRYYETVGRTTTAGNMQWSPIIRNFSEQWKALKERKDDDIDVPKITRSLPMLKWIEAFTDFLHRKVGSRTIPLAYVIHEQVEVPVVAPALANGRPYSTEHGSVEGELIARANHDHPLYHEDNAQVYYLLEEAIRGTSYAPSIKPFQRKKDGRGAVLSVTSQYAGIDKWEAELKRQDDFLHNRKWKGNNSFTLERFIAQHRNAFVSMTQCAQYVEFQLPNEYTRVGFLLTSIQCSDPKLQASMANVDGDTGVGGKRSDFEAAASFLLPKDPVAARLREGQKHPNATVSDTTADDAQVSAFGSKPGKGPKTGVHLRFYTRSEYNKLKDDEKQELMEWREAQRAKGVTFSSRESRKQSSGGKSTSKNESKTVSTTVAKEVQKQLKALKADAESARDDEEKVESYILSVVSKLAKAETSPAAPPKKRVRLASTESVPASDGTAALKSILRRVQSTKESNDL